MVQTTSHIFSGKVDIESNLLVGSSHLFVDTINNRVGVTTADPDASLHVNGNAYVESNVGVGSNIVLDGDTGIITATEFRGDGSNLSGVLTSLQNATDQGSTSNATIQLTNADTSLVASGNVVISGNVTSLTFIGDGSQLTGIATNLQSITDNGNVTSNTVQFTNTGTSLTASGTIEAAAVQVNGLDVALDQDMSSNAARVAALETELASNVTRVTNLEAANTVQESLINNLRTDVTSNTSRISSLEADRTSNTVRISILESANIIQESLINNLRTDLTSNTGRIADLEAANTVQETLINDLRTDVTSNAGRITDLETDLTSNTGRIADLEAANTVQETLINDLRTDMTSNTSRIAVLESNLTDNVTRIETLETANTVQAALISALESANTVQSTLITNLTTDLSSNAGRITDLETANGVQSTLITNLTTDLSSNAGRIDALELTTGGGNLTLQGITDLGNTTTNVVRFTNTTTGLVTTANVEVGGDVKISGLTAGKVPYVAVDQFLKDSFITTTADATLIASNLDVTGNIFMRGERFIVESETKLINDAIIGIANNNTTATTDVGILMQRPTTNVALIHHGGTDKFTIGYTLDDLEATDITNDTANIINVNILGNLYVQNVVTASSFLGDGTALTGVALQTDMASNAYRINTIETELAYPTFSTLTLDGIANRGNTTSNVLKLTNATTGLVADGNVHALKFIGDGSGLTGVATTLQDVTDNGNVTSNTVQFSNAITSLTADSNVVVTGNVTAGSFKGDGTGITGINLQQVAAVGHTTTTPLITSNTLIGKRTGAFDSKGDSTTEGEVFVDNLNAGEMTTQSISGTQGGSGITLTNPIVITYYVSNWLVNGQSWNDVFHFTFIEGLTYVFDISHISNRVQTSGPHIGNFWITGDESWGAASIPYDQGVHIVGTQGYSGAQFRWTVPRGASSFQGRTAGSHPGPGYFWFMTKPITSGSTSPGQITERRIRVISNPDQHILTGQTQIHGNLYSDSTIVSTNVEATDLVSSTRALISNVATMGTTKTFVVTVSNATGANKYYINGELQATIELHEHQTYIFDLSSGTLSGHPFVFDTSNSNDGTTSSNPYYTTGITSTGTYASDEQRTFVVPAGAPTTLYYYCTAHSGMGGQISISPTAELIVSGRVVASGNVEASKFIGDGSQLTGVVTSISLQDATDAGNTTSNTTQFTNATTSLTASGNVVASGNVTASHFVGDGSNVNIGAMTVTNIPYVDANKQLRDSHIKNAPDATIIASNLQVTGNIFVSGNSYSITSENTVINDRIIGLANNNTSTTLDTGLMLQYPQKNVAIIHHGTVSGSPHSGQLTVGYTQNTFVEDNVIHDANNITLNVIGHVITQNNITVGAQGSYYGDGTTLTGVALSADLTDNVTRIEDLETATIISNSSTITTGFTKGDIIYASADNVLNKLAIGGTDGYVLKVTSAANKTLGWAAETGGSGGSTVWQTNGNKIYYSTDNVGIGVTDPAFKLDVHGTANVGALTATSLSVGGQTLALATDLAANASRINTLYTEIRDNATAGDIIYADGANSLAKLSLGSPGDVLTVQGGLPAWVTPSGGSGGSGGGQWTTVNTNEIHYNGNVGIANSNPGHDLSVGSNLYVDDDGSNVLVVTGNTAMDSLTLGEVSIVASYGLSDILNASNTSSNIMQLTDATTGLVATGNVHALAYHGDGTFLTGLNLEYVANEGNATSNTVRFTNTTTGLVTTANVEVGGELTVSGNVEVGTANLFVDTVNSRIGIGTSSPGEKLHVNGNIRLGASADNTTDDNTNRTISTAGQLFIKANDSDLDGTYTNMILQAGNTNPGKIVIGGNDGAAYGTPSSQIEFFTPGATAAVCKIESGGFLLPKAFAFMASGSGGTFTYNKPLMLNVTTFTQHFDYHPNPNGIYRGLREQSGDGNRGIYFAPVKGVYHFSCKSRIPDNTTSTYEIEWYIKRNGSHSSPYSEVKYTSYEMWASPADGGGRRSMMSSSIVKLDVDEGFFPRNDGTSVSCSQVTFGGYFLGTYD